MATTPRPKPYYLDLEPVGSIEDLNARLPQLLANADFMLQELYEDLLAVSGDIVPASVSSGSGVTSVVNDTNVTGSITGSVLTLGWTGQLGVTRGGTGLATTTQGDIFYADASNSIAKLAKNGSTSRYLSNSGASNNPAWAQVDLTNGVTGVLPAANGSLETVVARSDTGTVNNWAPAIVGHSLIEWSGAADGTFTGLAGGVTGQRVTIKNTGTKLALFSHNSGSSTAGNRFQNLVTSGPTPVAAGGTITYEYDGTDWKLVNHLQGSPFTRTFAAGNYSVFSAGSWTVTSGQVITETYLLIGRLLLCQMFYQNTTVAGGPVVLKIKLPQGYTCGVDVRGATSLTANDNGAAAEVTLTIVGAGIADTTSFGPGRLNGAAWSAATNNTTVQGQAFIPVD